jgi:hypothetical protein
MPKKCEVKMSDFFKDLLKVIPEASYDLIARILPGGTSTDSGSMRGSNVSPNSAPSSGS